MYSYVFFQKFIIYLSCRFLLHIKLIFVHGVRQRSMFIFFWPPFIEKTVLSPLDHSDIFIINQVTVARWMFFLALPPISLVTLSILGLKAHCLSYFCFIVSHALWEPVIQLGVRHLLGFLDYLRLHIFL